eukprot:TRINITY_DN10242_c0_g2_i1.p1 TRINITY_DN10242_c0_g2~~TRINITY_DN10242_c0_g2_i1.p1  ORF type:complete len:987 (+),score=270.53 TRINITY_DN10242_c0_g2_i1:48-3008(+)
MSTSRSPLEWSDQEVALWLCSLSLEDYIAKFHTVNGAELLGMDEEALWNKGVKNRKDRRKLLDALGRMKRSTSMMARTPSSVASGTKEAQTKQLREMFPKISKRSVEHCQRVTKDFNEAVEMLLALDSEQASKSNTGGSTDGKVLRLDQSLQGESGTDGHLDLDDDMPTQRRSKDNLQRGKEASSIYQVDPVLVEQINELMPEVEPELVAYALNLERGDVDAAFELLLSLSTPLEQIDPQAKPDVMARSATLRKAPRAGSGPPPPQAEQVYMTITRKEYNDNDLYADPRELSSSRSSFRSELASSTDAGSDYVEVAPDEEDLEPDWGLVQECRMALLSDEASAPESTLSPPRRTLNFAADDNLNRLSRSFPELSPEQIAVFYQDHDQDMDATAEALLDLTLNGDAPAAASVPKPAAKSTAPPREPAPTRPVSSQTSSGAKRPKSMAGSTSARERKSPSRRSSVYVSRSELRRASVMMTEEMVTLVSQQRWSARPDVQQSGLLSTMSKEEVKRQEAMQEVLITEQAYRKDLQVLLKLLLQPLQAIFTSPDAIEPLKPNDLKRRSKRGSTSKSSDMEPESTFDIVTPKTGKVMLETVERLDKESSQLLQALKRRQSQVPTKTIVDILSRVADPLSRAFFGYCTTCFRLQRAAEADPVTPALLALHSVLDKANASPLARSLPIGAFILAPVQRLARYPMLIQAVQKYTPKDSSDFAKLNELHDRFTTTVRKCNARLQALEDYQQLERLQKQMDFSRLEQSFDLPLRTRRLLRKGRVQLVVLNDKGKWVKSKTLELFLFNDMMQYCKPVRHKKTDTLHYVVYKQIHRSLLEVRPAEATPEGEKLVRSFASKEGESVLMEVLLFGPSITQLWVRCPSAADRQRWLEAFNPPKEEQDPIYQEWNCPRARAIADYDAKQSDELTLRIGDIINILVRDKDGFTKGVITNVIGNNNRPTRGWFPKGCIRELDSIHQQAKVFKANMLKAPVSHDYK